MTNYIDGRWNGWNGGECPVPFHTIVEVAFDNGEMRADSAVNLPWDDNTISIIAYRVSVENIKPRDLWIFSGHVFSTFDSALTFAHGKAGQIIHVREVIE